MKSQILLKRLLHEYIRPYYGLLMVATVFMAVAAAMTAGMAFMLETILDDVFFEKRSDMIVPVASGLMMLFIVSGIATYVHTILMAKAGQSIVADIQNRLFSHFMGLDLAFFHKNPSGQLISRVINDVQVVRSTVSDALTGIGKNVLTLVFLVAVMVYQDWKLSIFAFCVMPIVAGVIAYLGRKLRKISKRTLSEMGNLSDRLNQVFQGIRQVKAYHREAFEIERAELAVERVKKLNIKTVRTASLSTPMNEMVAGVLIFGILVYGGTQITNGVMTAGELVSFLAAFIMAYEPMKKLARLNNTLQVGFGSAERIFEMMDEAPHIVEGEVDDSAAIKAYDIAFNNVVFGYENTDIPALDQVSFAAPPGKTTALVGPSGSGKSTILNLIPRFYDTQSGHILIGGGDIKSFTFNRLRSSIALVSQDITIFDGTIESNIAYGNLDASHDDIINAAQNAAAHDFITDLPNGYDTQVGENGVRLSGGQKQRIAIARALLKNAPILLLDEATSALDNESERLVQEALANLQKGRTTIAIAHRLSTVQNADQILVLYKGRIAERGTHDALMKQDGVYKMMVKSGLKD